MSAAIIPDIGLYQKFKYTLNKNVEVMLNVFGLAAAEAAYRYFEGWLDELMVYIEGNLDMLVEYF